MKTQISYSKGKILMHNYERKLCALEICRKLDITYSAGIGIINDLIASGHMTKHKKNNRANYYLLTDKGMRMRTCLLEY